MESTRKVTKFRSGTTICGSICLSEIFNLFIISLALSMNWRSLYSRARKSSLRK